MKLVQETCTSFLHSFLVSNFCIKNFHIKLSQTVRPLNLGRACKFLGHRIELCSVWRKKLVQKTCARNHVIRASFTRFLCKFLDLLSSALHPVVTLLCCQLGMYVVVAMCRLGSDSDRHSHPVYAHRIHQRVSVFCLVRSSLIFDGDDNW